MQNLSHNTVLLQVTLGACAATAFSNSYLPLQSVVSQQLSSAASASNHQGLLNQTARYTYLPTTPAACSVLMLSQLISHYELRESGQLKDLDDHHRADPRTLHEPSRTWSPRVLTGGSAVYDGAACLHETLRHCLTRIDQSISYKPPASV